MSTHEFRPTTYYSTLGAQPPVLTIGDGDSVVTTTVDAAGFDAAGVRHSTGGNPMTGPFFIAGAAPGDALAVHIDRLRPNRAHGFAGSVVAPNVVDPHFVRLLPEPRTVRWELDLEARLATLAEWGPTGQPLAIPFDPMLGCLGVAAAGGQAISTATSDRNGGNMDYRGIREGVTVIFPVFEPGALFFLGDGHATQGDGEIVGTGVEVSMDVRFTVRLLKNTQVGWPRVETDTVLVALGNARPLDQALQHATTELLHWLEHDYALDSTAASHLLGQCIAYEIANVFDPAYTVAAKIAKRWLQ
jgi:acetamidase/formamidase